MQFKKTIPTFLFYDYETFGTNASLDKPAQFACIRTDINFNIINQPECFYCFPSDDYFPDPCSILITGITPQYTKKNGMNEYNFSKRIYDILTVSNTCIVGFNNINFDDEFTRNIFYRNFFDPYEWSWKNGNSRWDVLNLLRACYALRPDGIQWPKNKKGFTSFKLSNLTNINNIMHNNIHDAMSDVYATIEIAKLIKKKQPKLFHFFFNIRRKNELFKLIDLKKFKPIIYISNFFGSVRNNISCILPITWHINNNNILIAIDLFQDVKKLLFLSKYESFSNNLIKILFESGITLIHFNRCPMLAPMQVIRKKDYDRLNFNFDLYNEKIKLLKSNAFFIKKIQNIFSQQNYFNESSNVDLQIYNSFFDLHDKKIIKIIRETNPYFLKKVNYNFHDSRLKTLLFRYRARNFFTMLTNDEKKIWLEYCINIFNTYSLQDYKNRIEYLSKENSSNIRKIKLLKKTLEYITQQYEKLFNSNINLN